MPDMFGGPLQWIGWGFGQPDLIEGVRAHDRGLELRDSRQTIL